MDLQKINVPNVYKAALILFVIMLAYAVYYSRFANANNLSIVKDWGKYETVQDLECSLKTKFINGSMQYVFSALYTNEESKNVDYKNRIEAFVLDLIDKDGFLIKSITIDEFTRIVSNSTNDNYFEGYKERGEIELNSSEEYSSIQTYTVAVRNK